MLDPQEQLKLNIWSDQYKGRPCPGCGKANWKKPRAATMQDVSGGTHGYTTYGVGRPVAVAVLACAECGFLLMFSLDHVLPPAP
jgi:hypothetical protein